MALNARILCQHAAFFGTAALYAALVLSAAGVRAESCELPERPELPRGTTASMEEMLAGQKAVQTFQANNMRYMKCLEQSLTAAKKATRRPGDSPNPGTAKSSYEASVAAYNAAYNAAVSAEEELAGDFNIQLRAYKAANK